MVAASIPASRHECLYSCCQMGTSSIIGRVQHICESVQTQRYAIANGRQAADDCQPTSISILCAAAQVGHFFSAKNELPLLSHSIASLCLFVACSALSYSPRPDRLTVPTVFKPENAILCYSTLSNAMSDRGRAFLFEIALQDRTLSSLLKHSLESESPKNV